MKSKNNIYLFGLILIFSINIFSCGGKSTVVYLAPTFQKAEALAALQKREKTELSSYKLLDVDKSIYQIPIDSAMVLLAGGKISN